MNEAKKSAKKLKGTGLDVFYQANNTAFSAGALLRLWKITKDKDYLELSYLCLAGIVKNLQLWLWKKLPNLFRHLPFERCAVYRCL